MKRIRRRSKLIASLMMVLFLGGFVSPSESFALTGHTSMPEYRSFEPVSTTNMVNLFNGSFTYNIPLIDVPNGYPINLSYHSSEVTPEAQASWVGLGWSLNPGAINRVKRGFPDEYDGTTEVTYFNKARPSTTVTLNGGTSLGEFFGIESTSIGLNGSVSYNNYQGVNGSAAVGLSAYGLANFNLSYSSGEFGFDASVNAGKLFQRIGKKYLGGDPKTKDSADQPDKSKPEDENKGKKFISTFRSNYGHSFQQERSFPNNVNPYVGAGLNVKFNYGINVVAAPVEAVEGTVSGRIVTKVNDGEYTAKPVGYFNNELATDGNHIMDYYSESDAIYEKRDVNLPIPFANNDIFNLSGEALGGSFRAFRSEVGHYRKNRATSETVLPWFEADQAVPLPGPSMAFSTGSTIGADVNISTVSGWDSDGKDFLGDTYFEDKSNEKFVLRFTGDRSGNFDVTNNDEPERADLTPNYITSSASLDVPNQGIDVYDKRAPRSTYISMKMNDDFSKTSNEVAYEVDQKELLIKEGSSITAYNRSSEDDQIGEIATYNADGLKYVYGLPIYNKEERQITYGIKKAAKDGKITFSDDNLIAHVDDGYDIDDKAKTKSGYYSPQKYATQLLLTQITSPDYIDRTFNGPTPDDFGSYTQFNYERTAGGSGDWFCHKSPYAGMNYSFGSLSDNRDDVGSFTSGEKELYYLNSIVSKTHVAVFTTSERSDGQSITPVTDQNNVEKQLLDEDRSGIRKKVMQLDKIDLYAIEDCELVSGAEHSFYQPKSGISAIKTVHFKYYDDTAPESLCDGTPNAVGGKLTLKQIWFEYEGKKTSKISPYVFKYNYPKFGEENGDDIPEAYKGVTYAPGTNKALYNYGILPSPSGAEQEDLENPDYSLIQTDRWGCYRDYTSMSNKLGDLSKFYPYVDQDPDYAKYDPAAWCLKQIELPSGGKILVQYEQNDYQFVQDKRVDVMVPLSDETDTDENNFGGSGFHKKYYLDLAKIGIDDFTSMSAAGKEALLKDLFGKIVGNKKPERLYFNFFYALTGDNLPDYTTTNGEFIEGFSHIGGYGYNDDGPFFVFKKGSVENESNTEFFPIERDGKYSKKEFPQKVCKAYYNTQRRGIASSGQSNLLADEEDEEDDQSKFWTFLDKLTDALSLEGGVCMSMDPEMSYVRLQMPSSKPKLAGGCRVKRLLSYDNGASVGAGPVLYGNEYDYSTTLGNGTIISSGVATNEPAIGRKECALVTPIEKLNTNSVGIFGIDLNVPILAGRNLYGKENPLGESLLPGASIGYSKIKVSNIHQQQTSTGYEIHEYYTCKDFPLKPASTDILRMFDNSFNGFGGDVSTNEIDPTSFDFNITRNTPHMTQGYSFVTNNMHGQPKKVSKYSHNGTIPLAQEVYEYFGVGEAVNVMDENYSSSPVQIGKITEVLTESRKVKDLTVGGGFGTDVTWGMIVPPGASYMITSKTNIKATYVESTIKTHVTNKIIDYPAIVKKVTSMADGIKHVTENLAFDKYTGNPVRVRTYDDFNKPYVSQDFMASWHYKNLRSKANNEGMKLKGAYVVDGVTSYIDFNVPGATCGAMDILVEGDFLDLQNPTKALYHISELDKNNNRAIIIKSVLNDESGDISSGVIAREFKIVKSGYTNELHLKDGNFVVHDAEVPTDMSNTKFATQHDFVDDLNDEIDDHFQTEGTADGTITLVGPYSDISLASTLSPGVPDCQDADGTLRVKNLEYILDYDGTANTFDLVLDGYEIINVSDEVIETVDCSDPDPTPSTPSVNVTLSNSYDCGGMPTSDGVYEWDGSLAYTVKEGCSNSTTEWPSTGIYTSPGQVVDLRISRSAGNGSSKMCVDIDLNSNQVPGWDDRKDDAPTMCHGETISGFGLKEFRINTNNTHTITTSCHSESNYSYVYACSKPADATLSIGYDNNICWHLDGASSDIDVTGIPTNAAFDYSYEWTGVGINGTTGEVSFSSQSQSAAVAMFNQPGTYEITYNLDEANYDQEASKTFVITVNDCSSPCDCQNTFFADGADGVNFSTYDFTGVIGEFGISTETGQIVYEQKSCSRNQPLPCVHLCNEPSTIVSIDPTNLISASAATFSDDWWYNALNYPYDNEGFDDLNSYESGRKGNWRVKEQFTYRKDINVNDENTNFSEGKFEFKLFDWREGASNNSTRWVKTTTIDRYTPNGEAVADRNILNIASSAKYGYNGTLPVLVAQNADTVKACFESFENTYLNGTENYFEDGVIYDPANGVRTSEYSHTGDYSIKMVPDKKLQFGWVRRSNKEQAYFSRIWVRNGISPEAMDGKLKLVLTAVAAAPPVGSTELHTYKRISSAGEWQLYEAYFKDVDISMGPGPSGLWSVSVILENGTSTDVYLDDPRFQPFDSEMVCYVYDHAQRLIAVMDDQHYAMLYEYNTEGILVRKLKETLEGIKTISETQYNTLGKNRNATGTF